MSEIVQALVVLVATGVASLIELVIDNEIFATGIAGLLIYKYKNNSHKVNAARAIFDEIGSAENAIDELEKILKSSGSPITTRILQGDAWKKYGVIFLKDFDASERQAILEFYNSCYRLEESVTRLQNQFPIMVEEKGSEIMRERVRKIMNGVAPENVTESMKAIENDTYWFTPYALIRQLESHVIATKRIRHTTIWDTLKKLARIN